ncbi:hypothetical protein D7V82_14680 [bacterium 1xD8-6]|nr:hypothetical protein D7V72_15950 [bacterium D16-36]RKI66559.1 hypothetical protein D7V82_14680 [bacterium 1xD8-6]
MGFKEDVATDLAECFFDEEFYASTHSIDGKEILVIIDEDGLEEIRKTKTDTRYRDEVHKHSVLFYVREDDMERKLAINSEVDFDGKMYYVNNISKPGGVWKILLGRNQV